MSFNLYTIKISREQAFKTPNEKPSSNPENGLSNINREPTLPEKPPTPKNAFFSVLREMEPLFLWGLGAYIGEHYSDWIGWFLMVYRLASSLVVFLRRNNE